jgi:hypothetical protein
MTLFPNDIRLPKLREALEATGGNITRAADVLEFSKTHAMRLVRYFELSEWARGLRELSGAPATGRPPLGV